MKNLVKTLAGLVTALSIGAAFAAGAGYPLDRFPTEKLTQQPALQNGAKLFVNYCLNCHGAALMRYNRLQDIGLTDDQIRKSLLFTADKVGDPMKVAIRPADAKAWFGALPPDLSVIARARASGAGSGADWLYTYLRAYFRDSTRPQGWNNVVFENVGMPHVFWELQGARGATLEEVREIIDDETGKSAGFTKSVVTFDADGVRTEKSEKLEGTKHHASRHWRQAVAGRVRRQRRRPGRLHHLDVRSDRADAHPARRLGAAVPRPVHRLCMDAEPRILERRQVAVRRRPDAG